MRAKEVLVENARRENDKKRANMCILKNLTISFEKHNKQNDIKIRNLQLSTYSD